MLIIGFSGKKGAGKDTLSSDIILHYTYYGRTATRYPFAGVLKEHCMRLFRLTRAQCYGTEEEKNSLTTVQWDSLPFRRPRALRKHQEYLTAREVLQIYGTEIVRSMNPEAWVDATLAQIQEAVLDIALIPDVRFPNEARAIRAVGGKLVRLTRQPYPDDGHASENALDDYTRFDAVIDNRAMSLSDQKASIRALVDSWLTEV